MIKNFSVFTLLRYVLKNVFKALDATHAFREVATCLQKTCLQDMSYMSRHDKKCLTQHNFKMSMRHVATATISTKAWPWSLTHRLNE